MPVEAAIEELKRNSGSQFDPMVIGAFLRVVTREGAAPLGGEKDNLEKEATPAKGSKKRQRVAPN